MHKAEDLTGKHFGRWLVLCRSDKKTDRVYWTCQCECGTIRDVLRQNLISGESVSCGCFNREAAAERMRNRPGAHRLSGTPLYRIWRHMRWRCNDTSNQDYANYGGRGIKVCEEWNSDFLSFYEWANASGYRKGLELDRINNDKGYSPENCRWATRKEQVRNRRVTRLVEINGVIKPLAEWCEFFGYSYGVGSKRLQRGIPLDAPFKGRTVPLK